VIVVGGYQSCSCLDDGSFDVLKKRLVAAGYDVERFGQDPRFPYDTFGAIEPNAVNLRDEVRDRGRSYAGVHIVTHSMGGVVADRAFADGLSARDGVLTYVSWSAPHSGSTAAVDIGILDRVSGDDFMRPAFLSRGMEPASAAVHDLAAARPVAPPEGVVRLDLREATDLLVSDRDATDPGVPSRVLVTPREGHAAILDDPNAIDLTMQTIANRRVPPQDARARVLDSAAQRGSRAIGDYVFGLLCAVTVALCVAVRFLRVPLRDAAWLARPFVGHPARKRCA